jgi:hypothetical protein
MSVYVGIGVHRKRSQVAVVTEDGQVQLNKNVVNGSEPMLRLIGDLPSGTPVAFEANTDTNSGNEVSAPPKSTRAQAACRPTWPFWPAAGCPAPFSAN